MNEKLRTARNDRRWTLEEAASKIGVARITYLRWEQGTQTPHGSTLTMACDALKMTPEQLGFREVERGRNRTTGKPVALYLPEDPSISDSVDMLHTGILALSLAKQQHNWTFEELLARTEQEVRRLNAMTPQEDTKFTRRTIISLLMSVPIAALGFEQENIPLLHEDEIISLCAVNIPLAWRLYFSGGLAEIKHMLPGYISKLSAIAQVSSRYRQQAACLTSQAHQLGYLLSLQSQNFSIAQEHAKKALQYAYMAEDTNLIVASLIRQGNLFFTLKRPLQTMQKYQEAVQQGKYASPLLQGQAYIGLAEAHAQLGHKQEALQLQGLAQDTFPDYPEENLHFAYTHFNHFTRTNFEGLMLLHLGKPKDAWEAFEKIDKSIPADLVPQRVELLSRQALTSVALEDLEQSYKYVELAGNAALKLHSDLRFNEASETYLKMQAKWPHEKCVKSLEDLFQQC